MFHPNPDKRITFSEIREHPVFAKNFPDGAGKSQLLYKNKVKNFKSQICNQQTVMMTPSRAITKKKGSP